jgi:hypothetical protein
VADANSVGASQAEIIKHLSSEIATHSEYLAMLRSRVALTILIGPFVVFGSFLLATKGGQISPQVGNPQLIAGGVASAAYLALGWYGARLDRQVTDQCDKWRRAILKVSNNQSLVEDDLLFKHRSFIAYMTGWVLILIAFISFASLLFSMLLPGAGGATPK